MITFDLVAGHGHARTAMPTRIEFAGRAVSRAMPANHRPPHRRRALSRSIAMLCAGIAMATASLPGQAQKVVTGPETISTTETVDESVEVRPPGGALTIDANGILNIGLAAASPRLDVQGSGAAVSQSGRVELGDGGVVTVASGGAYTMSGNAVLQTTTGGVALVNDGAFDISGVTTPIPGTSGPTGVVLGSLAGTGTVNMQERTLLTGLDNTDSAFSGTVNMGAGGTFIKVGTGKMTIDGTQFLDTASASNAVYVRGGALAQTSGTAAVATLAVGTGSGFVGALDISGGTLTIGTTLRVGDFGGIGTVNQTGGEVILTPLCGNASCVGLNIGNQGGTGTYNLSGGTLTMEGPGFLVVGRNTGANPPSTGVLNISGSGHAMLTGVQMIIGNSQAMASGASGGEVNQTGGTLTIGTGANLYLSGSGSGTYNLDGGILEVGGSSLFGNYNNMGGQYAFNLGGGTVRAYGSALTATGANTVNATLTATSTLDTNNLGITWDGVLSGDGGLDKAGAGTLTLNTFNTYKGPTTIAQGTLALGATGGLYAVNDLEDFANARVTVADGATFDFSAVTTLLPDPTLPLQGIAIGSLAGAGTVDMADKALVTGLDDTDSTFSGLVDMGATGTFIKVGTGTMTIDGARFGQADGTNAVYVGDGAMAQTSGDTVATSLVIGSGAGAGADLDVSGGTLTVGTTLHVGDFGGTGTVNQTGGALVLTPGCGTPANCVGLNIGNQGGTGTYHLSGGTLTMEGPGFLVVGRNTAANPASTGVLHISGSGHATLTDVQMVLGNNSDTGTAPSSSGTLDQQGGILTVGTGSNLYLFGSGSGTYNLDGGTLQIGGSSLNGHYGPALVVGNYTFNLGGGTVQAYGSLLDTAVDANLTTTSTFDTNSLGITWNGVLSGDGGLDKAGDGILRLTAVNTYSGGTHVLAGTLAVDRNDELGSGTVTLSDAGTLAVAPAASGDFTFNNALASATPGAGLFSVVLADPADAFAFADGSGGYSGTVQLGTGQFALSGTNSSALAAATLQLDSGNTTTVGAGVQTLGNLTLNGGRLDFEQATVALPTSITAGSSIATGDLALNSGEVVIDFSSGDLVNVPGAVGTGNLLSQDDDVQLQLISASGTVTGSASNVSLLDRNTQQPVSPPTSTEVTENGNLVALASYDFIFNTVDGLGGQGLFAGYGLRQLALQSGQTLTLAPDADAAGLDTDLAALLTGEGHLAIDAGSSVVSLSNPANDYTGQTHVLGGTLRLGNDGVLGLTSLLDIAGGAAVDLNGHAQAIGKLVTQAGSRLDLDGTLTITDALRAAGDPIGGMIGSATLFGAGTLNVDPSIVEVNGANAGYSGDVNVTEGSQLILNNPQGLGTSGLITLAEADDLLTFAQLADAPGVSASGTFSKQLAGSGTVQLRDAADIVLNGDSSVFGGLFDIASGTTLGASQATHLGQAAIGNEGTLDLSVASEWTLDNTVTGTGTLEKSGAAVLTVDQALAAFAGPTHVQAGTLRLAAGGTMAGSASIASGATLSLLDGTTVQGAVDNTGTVQANAGAASVGALDNAGTVLLAGAGIGNTLTVLDDYVGSGGTLEINTVLGNDDSPTDQLVVRGATSGTTLLQVGGVAGTTPATQEGIRVVSVDGASDGVFTLAGRAVAGAFDFQLFQGGVSDPTDGDWYLRAAGIRPEVGGYLGNQYAAVTMLQQTLRERTGESAFVAQADGGVSGWARLHRKQLQSGVEAGGLGQDVRVGTDLLQVGAGLVRSTGSQGAWQAGVMLSHGESTADSTSSLSGYTARGRVRGNAIGGYGTWFANVEAGIGLYVDGWLQYARFDNTVRGEGLVEESYDSDSWAASAEVGYGIAVHQGANSSLYIEPQVQLIYTDYSVDDHVERGGTVVSGGRAGGLTSRVGMRLHGRSNSTDWNRVQPFIEANWWNNGRDNDVVFDGQRLQQNLPDAVYEGRAGIEAELGGRWSGWAALGLQRGSNDYRNVSGGVGLRASW